jgi:hypothetical protein
MAVAGYRLTWLMGIASLSLTLPACSTVPTATTAPAAPAVPLEPSPVVSGWHQLPELAKAPAQGADVSRSPEPEAEAVDFWDRLEFDLDLALNDVGNFYSWPTVGGLALGIAAAAPLANTSADRSIHRWYQDHVKTTALTTPAAVATYAGQLWVLAPLSLEAMALLGKANEDYWMDGGLYEWGNRSLRAVAVGYPPAVALYGLLGSGRPDRNDSRWHPFRYFHGVSGHTFVGAVPFLTAASMTDEPLLKAPLVLGSFLTGWARLHDDRHYFSQIALGWWIALLSVHSVSQTQQERSSLSVAPCTPDGPGVSIQVRY